MTSQEAITSLQRAFPADQLHLPDSDAFKKLNGSYLSALENDIAPAAILQPKSAEEVCLFLKTVQPFVLTRGATVTFAIRGAGQQPLPGCANADGGITLDLGFLTGTQLDTESWVISIAAGERWGAVYEELHSHKRSITGSRSAKGGIGGLALAGGLSFFSTREGFICDNVVKYEVALASGEVVVASVDENPELYKALRGGGNNFGVVTKFFMRTFEQGPLWGGNVFYHPPSFPDQVDALVRHLDDDQVETHVMISLFFAAQFGSALGLNQVYYTREVENPPILDPFVKIEPQIDQLNSVRMINVRDAAAEQAAMSADGIRVAYMNTTVKADPETLKAAATKFLAVLEDVKGPDGLVFSMTLQPYPVSLLTKGLSAGGNVTGLTPADGPLVSVLILLNWKNKEDDEKILGAAEEMIKAVDEDATKRGTSVAYKYLNYAFTFQDPIGSYGAENLGFLRDVSKAVDPQGVFQKGVPGGFKLWAPR
ncbi:hypothetical protein F5Y18DRAFT_400325 [Xylariaceae sp. FL1019]|nr:hypothetical protein F5Y18DRAFT_400325 [Xylariaceae sp. FL1019]